jgi:hypothetical protein
MQTTGEPDRTAGNMSRAPTQCQPRPGVRLRRDDLIVDLPARHTVFLSARLMVSWLTDFTISDSNTLRARSRRVQFVYPFGGAPCHRDDLGFLLTVKQLVGRRFRLLCRVERRLESALDETLATNFQRLRATRESHCDSLIGPDRPFDIRFNEDLCSTHLLARLS